MTPIYNSATHLAATVQSVRAQTFTGWELVLFDDGSTDDSTSIAAEYAKSDSRIRVIAGDHGGISSARNRGFRATHPRSDYVAFLDSDDTWEPSALALLVGALETHPECAAAHGLARAVDQEGKQFATDDLAASMRNRREIRRGRCVDLPISAPTSFQAQLVKNYVVTPGTSLIRRAVFESLGGFEPALAVCEDWDVNLRIARHGGFALVDQVILNWRRRPGGVSHTAGKRWRHAYFDVMRRTVAAAENTPDQRAAVRSTVRFRCRESLAEAWQLFARRQPRAALRALALALLYLSVYCRSYRIRQRM